jgi:uncharacterized delta-60 repeat protein
MATTLTQNLKLRIDSNLTANAKYNLNRIDLLGSTFLVDSTNTLNLRSITNIVIEPNSADIGGTGIGGTVSIGTPNHTVELLLNGSFSLKDIATGSTGKLGLEYNSTLNGAVDNSSRTLTIDVEGANRSLVLGGNLTLSAPYNTSLTITLGNWDSQLIAPPTAISGEILVTRDGAAPLTNKNINADNNTITNITNSSIKAFAGIEYSKLQLAASIKDSDITSSFVDRIQYSKLNLAGKVRGSDIDVAYPISYEALSLLNSIKNSDVSPIAAIAGSKILPEFGNQTVKTQAGLELSNGTHWTKIETASSGQTANLTLRLPNNNGTANAILATDGAGNLSWSSAGSGSVTSVDLTASTLTGLFTVSGNPVTTNGTLTLTAVNQEANQVYASPAAGAAAQPTFRSLVLADLPTLTKSNVGLDQVDNTSDANKPVSSATQTALNAKYDASNPLAFVNVVQAAAAAPVQTVNGDAGFVLVNAINELTGDVTTGPAAGSEAKATTIANGVITNSKISASAAISVSKLAAGTNDFVLKTVAGVPTWAAESGGGGGTTEPTEMTVDEATRLGYKKYLSGTAYNGGVVPTITGSVDGTITGAVLIPYQLQDGSWRLKGSIPQTSLNVLYANTAPAFAGGGINATATQSDNSIIYGGSFFAFRGNIRNKLVRLGSDGTEDTAFYTNLGTGFTVGDVLFIAVQSDGKILVGGTFQNLNGTIRNRFVRLNSDGTVDTAFYTNLGTAFGGTVSAVAVQSDGKILVGGNFTTLNGITRNYLVRLNSDGTEDTAFYTNLGAGFSASVETLSIQSDGKILVGGTFQNLNGITRNRLVRLNSDGTVDTAFSTNLGLGFNQNVITCALQSDGKILVGGLFTGLNANTRNALVRLNSNGTEDTAFYTNLGASFATPPGLLSIAVQSDGKILAGGNFSVFNNQSRLRLICLNSDGTENTVFSTNLGSGFGGGSVTRIVVQSDNKIIVAGFFTTFRDIARNRIARLNTNGTEAEITSYTYTISGLNFSSTQSVTGSLGLGTATSGTNVITIGPFSSTIGSTLLSKSGCTFDVALTSAPTWAYTEPAPEITSVSYSNIDAVQGQAEVAWDSTATDWTTEVFDGVSWISDTSGVFSGPSPQIVSPFNRPVAGSGNALYRISVTGPAGTSDWVEFTVLEQETPATSIEITGYTITETSATTVEINATYTVTPPATENIYTLYFFSGGIWNVNQTGPLFGSPLILSGVPRLGSPGDPMSQWRLVVNASDGTSDEILFTVNAPAVPFVVTANADSNYNGWEALLAVNFTNYATSYTLDSYIGGMWQPGFSSPIAPSITTSSGTMYAKVYRQGNPMMTPTLWRVTLTNGAGNSTPPSEFMISVNSQTPPTITSATETSPTGNVVFNVQYMMGSMPTGIYEIQYYTGNTADAYSDLTPSNWVHASSGSVFSTNFTTDPIVRLTETTMYRIRVGNMGVGDSYSTWTLVQVTGAGP